MFTDNFGIFSSFIKNKTAFFARLEMDGKAHYIAGNRAARRILNSNKFQNSAKRFGLVIDLEAGSVA